MKNTCEKSVLGKVTEISPLYSHGLYFFIAAQIAQFAIQMGWAFFNNQGSNNEIQL